MLKQTGQKKGSLQRRLISTVFSTCYSPQFQEVKRVLYRSLSILHGHPHYKVVLRKGFRVIAIKARTIGNMTSPSFLFFYLQYTCSDMATLHIFECGATRCSCCEHLGGPHVITSCFNSYSVNVKQLVNCPTKFVVYLVTCISCHVQNVGRTTRRLCDRMRDHFSNINTNTPNTFQSSPWVQYSFRVKIYWNGRLSCLWQWPLFTPFCKKEVFCIFKLYTRIPKTLSGISLVIIKDSLSHWFNIFYHCFVPFTLPALPLLPLSSPIPLYVPFYLHVPSPSCPYSLPALPPHPFVSPSPPPFFSSFLSPLPPSPTFLFFPSFPFPLSPPFFHFLFPHNNLFSSSIYMHIYIVLHCFFNFLYSFYHSRFIYYFIPFWYCFNFIYIFFYYSSIKL